MNLNPLAILFSIIALPEPAIEDDDTALFTPVADEPPVLHFSKIELTGLLSLDQLCGALVAYRPDNFSEPVLGHIRGVEETKIGRVSLYFQPQSGGISKWRDLSDFVYAVWY